MDFKQENIRNFSIIAHIDHGKSTLADRILEITGAVSKREMKDQLLDSMDLERERGITIKLNAVGLKYHYQNETYLLNLIDTPGHVDFSYEVSRSLAACDGAILVVDAVQGIEAQTLSNLYLALNADLKIIPVINKIDLPNANIAKVKEELKKVLGFKEEEILLCSGKTGEGIKELIEAVITRIPAPKINNNAPLKALIFDSYFDPYKGVVGLIKVSDGAVKLKDEIMLMATGKSFVVTELGIHTPKDKPLSKLSSGTVGYICASIKDISSFEVGDTITLKNKPALESIAGYQKIKPMVYSGIFPLESNKFEALKEAFEKLKLNDSALTYEVESSDALGFGFRVGFLGLLHMDIITERLEREFQIPVIVTSPSVIYHVYLTNEEMLLIDNPNKMPPQVKIKRVEEPYIITNIIVPDTYIGAIMKLCQNKRGIYKNMEYLDETRVNIHYELPLSEIVYDFFDKLKSTTKGYASFDYEFLGYKPSNLVKMNILLNGNIIDALSVIVHKDFAYQRGMQMTKKLKETIPRQLFQVPIQAQVGSKVIARETISAMRKNVLAKCYGGDITRKRKLLDKQKEGKKKMKQIGNVEVPQEAFLAILSKEEQ